MINLPLDGLFFVLVISLSDGSGNFAPTESKQFTSRNDCFFAREVIKNMFENIQAECYELRYRKVEEPKK